MWDNNNKLCHPIGILIIVLKLTEMECGRNKGKARPTTTINSKYNHNT